MRPNNNKLFLLLLVAFFGNPMFAAEQEIIEFCDFEVPKIVAHANASFPVIYSMDIDSTGAPINITKINNHPFEKIMPDEPFLKCFQKWKLPTSYGKVEIHLNWKHAIGWTSVSLIGKDVVRRWNFQQGWQVGIKKD